MSALNKLKWPFRFFSKYYLAKQINSLFPVLKIVTIETDKRNYQRIKIMSIPEYKSQQIDNLFKKLFESNYKFQSQNYWEENKLRIILKHDNEYLSGIPFI